MNTQFPPQGQPMQQPDYWNQMYGGRNNPFDAMRQQQRISAIPGRMVQSEQDIKPNDVPMDGSVALFPTSDMSCVYGKAWNGNGQIITVRYVPEQPQQADQTPQKDPFQEMVDSRLTAIEEALSKLTSKPEKDKTEGGSKK